MNLDSYIRLLQTADTDISREAARLFTEYADDMTEYTQSIMHKQSGNMAASTYRLGPFAAGAGVLEATIQSGAWYAEEEAKKGGTHDFATRTIQEQQARILQLELELANMATRVLTGSSNG